MKMFVNVTATIVLFGLFGLAVFVIGGINYSQLGRGEHSGFITAIDQRGYIWRNYDVYFKTDNSSSQEDIYCIFRDDQDLIEKAMEVNKSRKQVTITYKGVRTFGWGLCSHAQIIDIR